MDFASQESQMAFYRSMQASGQDIRDFYEIPPERRYISLYLALNGYDYSLRKNSDLLLLDFSLSVISVC